MTNHFMYYSIIDIVVVWISCFLLCFVGFLPPFSFDFGKLVLCNNGDYQDRVVCDCRVRPCPRVCRKI